VCSLCSRSPSDAHPDWPNLEKALRYAVRFLDDVLTYNYRRYPLIAQAPASISSRRIDVGFTGLADVLVKMSVRYDSEASLAIVEELFSRFKNIFYDESCNIAAEKGRRLHSTQRNI
jgi:ribonucleoside-diphosphate reductase alpha chain